MAATTPIATAPEEAARLAAPEDTLFDGGGTEVGVFWAVGGVANAGEGVDGTMGAAAHVATIH